MPEGFELPRGSSPVNHAYLIPIRYIRVASPLGKASRLTFGGS